MDSDFGVQRNFFSNYRIQLSENTELKSEITQSIAAVLQRYDTKVWENRFIVGGVVEQIIGSSARSLGFNIRNAGKNNQGYDLELSDDDGAGVSIKPVFASINGKHNLINKRGGISNEKDIDRWKSATMFVLSGVGIGYVDPVFCSNLVTSSGDAIQISGKGVQNFWKSNPEWFIEIEIPKKIASSNSRVASDAVSFDLFQDFQTLRIFWEPEI